MTRRNPTIQGRTDHGPLRPDRLDTAAHETSRTQDVFDLTETQFHPVLPTPMGLSANLRGHPLTQTLIPAPIPIDHSPLGGVFAALGSALARGRGFGITILSKQSRWRRGLAGLCFSVRLSGGTHGA